MAIFPRLVTVVAVLSVLSAAAFAGEDAAAAAKRLEASIAGLPGTDATATATLGELLRTVATDEAVSRGLATANARAMDAGEVAQTDREWKAASGPPTA